MVFSKQYPMKEWVKESDEYVMFSGKIKYPRLFGTDLKKEINAFHIIKKLHYEGWQEQQNFEGFLYYATSDSRA